MCVELLGIALLPPHLVISVLGPAPAVDARGLDVAERIGRDPDVVPGLRDAERGNAFHRFGIADLGARVIAIAETSARPLAVNPRTVRDAAVSPGTAAAGSDASALITRHLASTAALQGQRKLAVYFLLPWNLLPLNGPNVLAPSAHS